MNPEQAVDKANQFYEKEIDYLADMLLHWQDEYKYADKKDYADAAEKKLTQHGIKFVRFAMELTGLYLMGQISDHVFLFYVSDGIGGFRPVTHGDLAGIEVAKKPSVPVSISWVSRN